MPYPKVDEFHHIEALTNQKRTDDADLRAQKRQGTPIWAKTHAGNPHFCDKDGHERQLNERHKWIPATRAKRHFLSQHPPPF